MMRVGMRLIRSLNKRRKALDFPVQHRILGRTIVLVTKELNNGSKHGNDHVETDVDEDVGKAYEDALSQNRFNAGVETNRILREILAREELRPR